MPPLPSRARTSYGPTWVVEGRGMRGRDDYSCGFGSPIPYSAHVDSCHERVMIRSVIIVGTPEAGGPAFREPEEQMIQAEDAAEGRAPIGDRRVRKRSRGFVECPIGKPEPGVEITA